MVRNYSCFNLETLKKPEQYYKKSFEVFDEFKQHYEPSIVEYNLLIQVCALSGNIDKAFELFEEVKKKGLKPEQQTYGVLIRACTIANQKERGRPVWEELIQKKIGPNYATYDEIFLALKTL